MGEESKEEIIQRIKELEELEKKQKQFSRQLIRDCIISFLISLTVLCIVYFNATIGLLCCILYWGYITYLVKYPWKKASNHLADEYERIMGEKSKMRR